MVHSYAKKINVKPSLVLSQYEYSQYLSRCGGELSSFYNYRMKNNIFRGSCDCVWVTKDRGVFVIQMNSVELTSNNESNVLEYIRKTWEQTQKAKLVLRSLICDKAFKSDMKTHQIIALPNLNLNVIQKYLYKYGPEPSIEN